MKKFIAILLTLALMLTAVMASASAETLITVTGSGETRVAADTTMISLGVSVREKDVQQAQQQANARIAAIRDALITLGVPEENINTNYINIYAIYDYSEGMEQIQCYSAGSSLSIKVTDMDMAGAVIDAAFAAGANTLDGISFSASDTEDAEAESMKKAVADARAKAEILAEAAGLKITGIKSIDQGGSYSYRNTVSGFDFVEEAAAEKTYGGETVVQAARVVISAAVNITFTADIPR